jgi:site-specific DNA-adenine methylase
MKSLAGTLAAPFPYFGGKSLACETVWAALGDPENYVEPFAGSAAMLLGRPKTGHIETINDADGFVANFWRAVSHAPDTVASHADWPCNEVDLFSRHSWLVRQVPLLVDMLNADPEFYDAKIAGWWCWGACNWIGSGWCAGTGPWIHNGEGIVDARKLPHLGNAGRGINRQLPHLGNAGRGINRQLPHLGDAGQGINRKLPHLGDAGQGASAARSAFILEWFEALCARTRNVRVASGDWSRVLKESVTTRHGLTGIFLDPPYTKGAMDYAAQGTGGAMADEVRAWCVANGSNGLLRIVLCGHAGEHDELLAHGWHTRAWAARKGYASTDEALENSASETLWCSPSCIPLTTAQRGLFAEVD